ncbi:MAG: hypothetical protein GY757_08570, partial [bacterium]|nr:hypothetical protein [bacterium]
TSGRLKSIADFCGRKVAYTYDTVTGDLYEVDRNSGSLAGIPNLSRKTRYEYEVDVEDLKMLHNLEKVIDPRGVLLGDSPVLTVHYFDDDKVEKQDFIELDKDIIFTITEGTTTVTDAREKIKTFNFSTENKRKIIVEGFTMSIELSADNLIENITSPAGNSIQYTYDSENNSRLGQANVLSVTRTGKEGFDTITTSYTYN